MTTITFSILQDLIKRNEVQTVQNKTKKRNSTKEKELYTYKKKVKTEIQDKLNKILEYGMPENTPIISTTPVSTIHKTFYIIGLSAIITCVILTKIYQT